MQSYSASTVPTALWTQSGSLVACRRVISQFVDPKSFEFLQNRCDGKQSPRSESFLYKEVHRREGRLAFTSLLLGRWLCLGDLLGAAVGVIPHFCPSNLAKSVLE